MQNLLRRLYNAPLLLNAFLTKRLQGGALYIAVIISIVLGIILSFFLLLSRYTQRTMLKHDATSQLYLNVENGFQLSQSYYFADDLNNHWFKTPYNDDSLKIKKIQWGAYQLISVTTKNRHDKLSQAGLFGTFLPSDTSILISDYGRPVAASGQVKFSSNAYLPKATIKSAYIEGQSFSGGSSLMLKSSPSAFPDIEENFGQWVSNAASFSSLLDSLILSSLEIVNSFSNKTAFLVVRPGTLSNMTLKDNIKIVCDGDLVIDSSCRINNILVVAKKVRFKDGFNGSLHVIASDSIISGKESIFAFPSSFLLYPSNDASNMKSVLIENQTKFYGGIVSFGSKNDQQKTFVKISSDCEVNGLIYAGNYLHLEGKIFGSVIADKLLLITPSAVYENHLLNCEIDPKKMQQLIAVPLLFKRNSKLFCCKYVS